MSATTRLARLALVRVELDLEDDQGDDWQGRACSTDQALRQALATVEPADAPELVQAVEERLALEAVPWIGSRGWHIRIAVADAELATAAAAVTFAEAVGDA